MCEEVFDRLKEIVKGIVARVDVLGCLSVTDWSVIKIPPEGSKGGTHGEEDTNTSENYLHWWKHLYNKRQNIMLEQMWPTWEMSSPRIAESTFMT